MTRSHSCVVSSRMRRHAADARVHDRDVDAAEAFGCAGHRGDDLLLVTHVDAQPTRRRRAPRGGRARRPAHPRRGAARRSRRRCRSRRPSRSRFAPPSSIESATLASAPRWREPWFGIYLPQLRMPFERILERTLAAEAAGFDSVWLMDHFTAPAAPEVDTLEGFDGRDRARGAHLDDPHRPPRALRPVPPSRAAGQDGRDLRRHLRRPARARHRLGVGARRAAHLRVRARAAGGARREAARDARDPRA